MACFKCNNSGWVAATCKKNYLYSFRCNCSLGNRYSDKIKMWDNRFASEYKPDFEVIAQDVQKIKANDKVEYDVDDCPF